MDYHHLTRIWPRYGVWIRSYGRQLKIELYPVETTWHVGVLYTQCTLYTVYQWTYVRVCTPPTPTPHYTFCSSMFSINVAFQGLWPYQVSKLHWSQQKLLENVYTIDPTPHYCETLWCMGSGLVSSEIQMKSSCSVKLHNNSGSYLVAEYEQYQCACSFNILRKEFYCIDVHVSNY